MPTIVRLTRAILNDIVVASGSTKVLALFACLHSNNQLPRRWRLFVQPRLARIDGCRRLVRLRPCERLTDGEWQEDLDLNLLGAVRAIRGALKALRQAQCASIVLFSSVAAGTGLPFHASIAAAKGAVEGMTRALAAELAPRIRVNALAPTVTDTALAQRLLGTPEKRAAAAERHPLKTIGTPDDIARAALWLLEDARMTTGQVLNLDGGLGSIR